MACEFVCKMDGGRFREKSIEVDRKCLYGFEGNATFERATQIDICSDRDGIGGRCSEWIVGRATMAPRQMCGRWV